MQTQLSSCLWHLLVSVARMRPVQININIIQTSVEFQKTAVMHWCRISVSTLTLPPISLSRQWEEPVRPDHTSDQVLNIYSACIPTAQPCELAGKKTTWSCIFFFFSVFHFIGSCYYYNRGSKVLVESLPRSWTSGKRTRLLIYDCSP